MDNDMNSDDRVVVILGMDRSGTSLCTNILNALGMRLSPRLVEGNQFNPDGHFEDEDLFHIHEWILAGLDRSWDTLATIHPMPELWWQSPAMDPFRDALVDIVRSRINEGPGIWGFKDPRAPALLPLWNEAFRICGVRPVFVLCVRHPAAVAHSLATRDRFSLLFSELLWFEKTLTGCLAIQGSPHCLIHYEEWFDDPLPQTRMLCKIAGLAPEARPAELKARVSSIVKSALRHKDGGVIISAAARDLYAHLVHSPKVPEPDVLKHFEFACDVARDFIATAELLMGERYLGQSASRDKLSALAEDRFRWILRCQASERRSGELEEDRARWMQGSSGGEQDLHERDVRLRELEEERARWMERFTGAEQALVEREARLRETEEDRARCMERCTGAEQALVEREARLRETEEDRARCMERCTGAEQALVEREARLHEAEEDRARWTEQFSHAASLLSKRDAEIAAIRTSATWRWTQHALKSWPSRLLLGPFIRAVAERRKG